MPDRGVPRDRGLNAARGVAVLLILVAQTTPGSGPFRLLMLSELVPPALLAVLIGMTAQVARAQGAGALVNLLWGSALLAFAGVISLVPSEIVGILGYLGCLGLLTAVLVRMPVGALVAAGVALLAFIPWAVGRVTDLSPDSLGTSWFDHGLLQVLEAFAGDSRYRVLALTLYAIAGVLLARLVADPDTHGYVVGCATVVALGVNAVDHVGTGALMPTSGSVQMLMFGTSVAVGIAAAGHWAGARRGRATGAVTETLADVGGMWLSVYVLMVLGTAAHLWVDPIGGQMRAWSLMIWSVLGAVALAMLWVRVFAGTIFEQGPIEGILERLAGREPTLRSATFRRRRSAESLRSAQSLRRRT